MSGITASILSGTVSGGGGGGGTVYSVTVGYNPSGYGFNYYGFESGVVGSISPTVFTNNSATIVGLYVLVGYSSFNLFFTISGSAAQNIFTTLKLAGVSYSSASASYTSGVVTTWSWTLTSNPMSSIGTVIPVTIT